MTLKTHKSQLDHFQLFFLKSFFFLSYFSTYFHWPSFHVILFYIFNSASFSISLESWSLHHPWLTVPNSNIMGFFILLLSLTILEFLSSSTASPNDHVYNVGDEVPFFVNKVGPLDNPRYLIHHAVTLSAISCLVQFSMLIKFLSLWFTFSGMRVDEGIFNQNGKRGLWFLILVVKRGLFDFRNFRTFWRFLCRCLTDCFGKG